MLREHFFHKVAPTDSEFRWRGMHVSRIESLTDAVFAFAITLLVITIEAPKTSEQMWLAVKQVPAFAVCFFMLTMLWFFHFQFFRRFGLEDFPTLMINSVFLFVVLIYVYPLRLLFTWLVNPLFGISRSVQLENGESVPMIPASDMRGLMIFYSAGCALAFLCLGLLYLQGFRRRHDLELDAVELLVTKSSIGSHLIVVLIALLAMTLAILRYPGLGGMSYFAVAPVQAIHGTYWGRRIDRARRVSN